MRILFISDCFHPETNAPSIRGWMHAREWVKHGHEVTVITSFPNFPDGKVFPGYRNKLYQVEFQQGVRIVRVWTYISRNRGIFRRSLDYLSFGVSAFIAACFIKNFDIILATSPQFFSAVAGTLAAKVRRIQLVLEIRDLWPASITAVKAIHFRPLLALLELLELALYRNAHRIVTVTESAKKDIVQRGISEKKIEVVYNGIEMGLFHPRPKNILLQDQLGLRDRFVIGYMGTFGMAHGLGQAIEAASRLKNLPAVRFLFVGSGAEQEILQQIIQKNELKNVLLLPRRPHSEIADYWNLCDLALISLRDTPLFAGVIPSKMFEAAALGIPLVMACPEGEATQLMQRYGCAVRVPPADAGALEKQIRHLYTDKETCKKMATNGAKVAAHFDRRIQAKKMTNLFENMQNWKKAA
jgi:glycosyltransferase involved in cell wall biosynthesis